MTLKTALFLVFILLHGCGGHHGTLSGYNSQTLKEENARLQKQADDRASQRVGRPATEKGVMEGAENWNPRLKPLMPVNGKPPPPPKGMFDAEKNTCKELGFKVGTKDFGNCVMKLMD